MIDIDIAPEFQNLVSKKILHSAGRETLVACDIPEEFSITIAVRGDTDLHDLNNRYRGVDSPTDVLAFPSHKAPMESEDGYLGDIILSYPRANEQAQTRGHSVQEELQLLTIHGILHLLGEDHHDSATKRKMWKVQKKVLLALGNLIDPP